MPALAQAHLLKVFAWAQGEQISGNAYFSGGIPAAGAHIRLQDSAGNSVAIAQPDAKGDFTLTAPAVADYSIVADTEDGHIAHWDIKASEIDTSVTSATVTGNAEKRTGGQRAEISPVGQPVTNTNVQNGANSGVYLSQQQLEQIVEAAVAAQVGPLRLELQHYADRIRLSDLLGGIGMIFGIAGLLFWLKARKTGA